MIVDIADIIPVRFFVYICDEHYVQTLNSLKTFNRHPTNIELSEQRVLSKPVCTNIDDYQLKLKSRGKLEEKAQDIKCSFCVIAKSKISYLKNLIEELKSGQQSFVDIKADVIQLENEVRIILHLLMFTDLVTGKWIWIYFLKVIAFSRFGENEHYIRKNIFEDDQLESGVSEFIKKCTADGYLPALESDLVSEIPSIHKQMFDDLQKLGWDLEFFFINGYVMVTTDFLYLKPFWKDETKFLFGQITGATVDWSKAKRRFELEVAVTKKFVENRTWIHEPYGRLDHQHMLVKIVDARLYCYLSVVLHIYEKQLTILEGETLKNIKDDVYKVIQYALSLTGFKNDFLVAIMSEFKFAKTSDTQDIDDISARARAKADETLNDLNGVSKNKIDWLSPVSLQQLQTAHMIMGVIDDFNGFLNELKRICLPFEYRGILHFIDVVEIYAK
ncbi:uncharacterized protein LOC126836928 [Adelges cooleyi]|uniref:uncharacterized protein LOC126836928 n=1 Tax=Adelges cooleyi TaxID=133065 RepID=UPI002180840A|nr:uncharacterized protein LOC126836928 [Adelges cooleyi]